MKRAFVTLWSLLFLIISFGDVLAQETEEIAAEDTYKFPKIEPEVYVYGGYRFVGHSGDHRAEQYEYLYDSLSLGGELRVFSFPHRLHLDIDFRNGKDFFGDASYAYKDIVLFRGINRTLFHNLENINLIDLDPLTSSPGVDAGDGNERYGVKFGHTAGFLRFKVPDFPLHLYFDGTFVTKDGTEQLRSLGGSGYFNDIVRVSRKRNMDWQSNNIVFGTNTHLGPIEMDISHGEKRLEVKGDRVFFDAFRPAIGLSGVVRSGGIFAHNPVPEFKSSSNTLKAHTSYTGALVASATFSNIDRENMNSGAKAEYFIGAGEVTWMPMPRLAVFAKYRHKEIDIENPGTATITDINNPSNTYVYLVRPSLSSTTDTASGTIRYRPLTGLTLLADYSYESIRRTNSDDWKLPESTTRNTVALSANLRIAKGLTLKARYKHKDIDSPAYNSEPDHSDEGRVSVSWTPAAGLNVMASYSVVEERRNDIRFTDLNFDLVEGPQNRNVKTNRFLGSVTFLILKDVSLTTSYTYIDSKTRQDLVFHSATFKYVTDSAVPNKDIAHNYAVDVSYMPKNNLNFNAGFSHTISKGSFFPGSVDLLEPVSIAAFSDLKLRESIYSVSGEYRFRNGFAVGLRYRYSKLDDVLENPYDDFKDGRVQIILMTISKKW
ncbi:MAG TPA: MtrB/PioB family outer membrane beta-barrel protein [Thermodesulfovibrionales bacterium]|nr:MtrB/PioB family outer membrane beta-barrel protein [Thermodesulfovibrionales bacterium]